MIEKIYYPINIKTNLSEKKIKNKKTETILKYKSNPIYNYSFANVLANNLPPQNSTKLISFGTAKSPKTTQTKTKEQIDTAKNKINKKRTKPVTSQTDIKGIENLSYSKSKITGEYYEKYANNLAVLLGPDKNVVLVPQDGVDVKLFAQKFAQKVAKGLYKGQGLDNNITEVLFINNTQELNSLFSKSFISGVNKLSKSSQTKKIVFINNFKDVMQEAHLMEFEDINEFLSQKSQNIMLVGIIPKKELIITDNDSDYEDKLNPFKLNKLINTAQKFEINGLTSSETEKFFQDNPFYMDKILQRYDKAKFNISPDAVKTIIKRSETKIDGSFPGKVLNVLDYVLSIKANETVKNKTKTITVNSSDIDDLFINHPEIINVIKTKASSIDVMENITTRLNDIGGMEQAKKDMEDIINFSKDPKGYIKSGKNPPKNIILAGPPGTGKTLLVRAVAGEAEVPFISLKGKDLGDIFVNSGVQKISESFAKVREIASQTEKKIAILFIDEIDSIGKKRGNRGASDNSEDEKRLNQLLIELDGIDNKESDIKIITIGATNREDLLDEGLTDRPTRFNVVKVNIPANAKERLEILKIHAKGKPFANEIEKEKILKEMSELTIGLNGDKLSQIINQGMNVVFERQENRIITFNDIYEGFMRTTSGRKTVIDAKPEEKRTVVAHEAGHAIVTDTLKQGKVSFISNEARGDALGVTYIIPDNTHMETFDSFLKTIAVDYAGAEAEKILNGKHASGVSGDYKSITMFIENAIKHWGFGIYTPQISFYDENDKEIQSITQNFQKEIKKDIELFSKIGQKIAKLTLEFNKDFLLNTYLKKYDDEIKAGKGGDTLSGEAFSVLRKNWKTSKGLIRSEETFLKKIDKLIDKVLSLNIQSSKIIAKKTIRTIL